MKGKRSKQYRKLMQQYGIHFGFREPYQVLLDAEIIKDAARFSMDLTKGLERTLHGKIKPMLTQCSMRHLYTAEPRVPQVVGEAKTYERRRCNHHTLDEPLSTIDCLQSVVDPKNSRTNKHRYVVASQDSQVRASMRRITGVPMIYINRSVMIMEPMAGVTEDALKREEKGKFRAGLKSRRGTGSVLKRKREEDPANVDEGNLDHSSDDVAGISHSAGAKVAPSKKRSRGPKGPNPLSVKKAKRLEDMRSTSNTIKDAAGHEEQLPVRSPNQAVASVPEVKRKRRRKHKSRPEGNPSGQAQTRTVAST
ncbi:MAG: hypothetical protein M1817_005047 [Caeruleum heppii]|nr:MAG: hypothetical protein M1817_005047 [Caeruleum heppii]